MTDCEEEEAVFVCQRKYHNYASVKTALKNRSRMMPVQASEVRLDFLTRNKACVVKGNEPVSEFGSESVTFQRLGPHLYVIAYSYLAYLLYSWLGGDTESLGSATTTYLISNGLR